MGKLYFLLPPACALCLCLSGCYSSHRLDSTHEIKPVEIKPIHITIDVNVKVDKALDDFFGDLDKKQVSAPKQEASPAAPQAQPVKPEDKQETENQPSNN